MRWKDLRKSSNIEDQRGRQVARSSSRSMGKGIGVGGIVLAVVALALGADPATVINMLLGGAGGQLATQQSTQTNSQPYQSSAGENELADFVSVVLADTETTWQAIFRNQLNRNYEEPRLVMFSNVTNSGCGQAQSAMGPFYCPADRKVYIDLGFYQELRSRHDAPGDFAQAYVIAHEVGHHVQTLLGISSKVHQARRQVSQVEGNKLQVKMELQADCFAGLWAAHADHKRNLVERGDIDEALNAARQIGDDTLQRKARGKVVPESFTHGSSAQRASWFKQGYQSGGQLAACDTFKS